MSRAAFARLCLVPLALVTTAFFLVPMARLMITGGTGPLGLAAYTAILTGPLRGHHCPLTPYRAGHAYRNAHDRRARRLRVARARRARGAADRRSHHPAARHSRPRHRARTSALLRGSERLSPLILVHSGGPRGVHAALHGALRDAVFASIDVKTLDESAASLGASPWRRFRDVIVPNATPGILAGSLMVVTLSLGEFNLTWMLHTPLTKTLPVGTRRQLCLHAS